MNGTLCGWVVKLEDRRTSEADPILPVTFPICVGDRLTKNYYPSGTKPQDQANSSDHANEQLGMVAEI